jgi:hypothetical protein
MCDVVDAGGLGYNLLVGKTVWQHIDLLPLNSNVHGGILPFVDNLERSNGPTRRNDQ